MSFMAVPLLWWPLTITPPMGLSDTGVVKGTPVGASWRKIELGTYFTGIQRIILTIWFTITSLNGWVIYSHPKCEWLPGTHWWSAVRRHMAIWSCLRAPGIRSMWGMDKKWGLKCIKPEANLWEVLSIILCNFFQILWYFWHLWAF